MSYDKDIKSLHRIKSKIKAYNSISNPSGSHKLKIMSLIQYREEINNRLKNAS